jgi:hypothetical protein
MDGENHRQDPSDANKKAMAILKAINRPVVDVSRLVKESIEEVKGLKYIPNNGKPDQSRSLRKEVSDGTL